jgi:hypothetical protein
VATSFYTAYKRDISPELLQKAFTSVLNCSKSSNPVVRTSAVDTLAVLLHNRVIPSASLESLVSDLLVLPKSGKTSSAEHRQTLYAMMAKISPMTDVSTVLAFTLPGLLAKENNETVIPSLRDSLAYHFTYIVRSSAQPIPAEVTSVLVKEAASTKPSIRRAFLHVIGVVFEPTSPSIAVPVVANGCGVGPNTERGPWSTYATALAKALMPSLEANLKVTVASPLNVTSGPMEGYVTVGTFVHPKSPVTSGGKSLDD